MLGGRSLCIGIALLISPSLSTGGPMLADGNLEDWEHYDICLSDPLEGTFPSASWDLVTVRFDLDRSFFYIAVDTAGRFVRSGAQGGASGRTEVLLELSDTDHSASQEIRLVLTSATEELYVDGERVVSRPMWQWHVATGQDLEIALGPRIVKEFVIYPWPPEFDVRVVLDHGGTGPKDELVGRVPEPATLGLLAVGGLSLLRRRRQ